MNINGTIWTPGGETYLFGGEGAAYTTTYKGYFVSLEWFIGNRTTEPMMIIQSARRAANDGALGICLSSIGAYADPSGRPADGALDRVRESLRDLGKDTLDIEVHTLMDVILHFAPKLILMPPTPRKLRLDAKGEPIWEVTRKENGRKVQEVTI